MSDHAAATTVIVARRVRVGREAAAERWIDRIRREAASAPGFLGADSHPPGPEHPDEWIVVYSFDSGEHLDAWLAAPERAVMIDAGRDHFEGAVREQRLAAPPVAETITLVSSVRLRPGTEERHRVLHDAGVRDARTLGGLVRAELLPAVEGVQPETVALLTFAERDHLDTWLASEERAATIAAMDDLTDGDRTINVVGGFGGWFAPTAGAPARWKQAVAVLLALVPVSLLTTTIRQAVWPNASLAAAVVVGAVINVAILTWLVMPALSRRLEPWLGS